MSSTQLTASAAAQVNGKHPMAAGHDLRARGRTLGNPTMADPAREPTPLPHRKALQERVSSAILHAAAQTLALRGDSANLADVAEAAGVARATVYRYYPNRRRLVEELVRHATESIRERLLAARIEEVPVDEGLTRTIRAFVDEGDFFVVAARERRRADGSDFDRVVVSPLQSLLDAGRSEGRIRPGIPTVVLAEALVSLAAGVLRNCSLGRDDVVATLSTVFLEGALAPPSPDAIPLSARRARSGDQGGRDER